MPLPRHLVSRTRSVMLNWPPRAALRVPGTRGEAVCQFRASYMKGNIKHAWLHSLVFSFRCSFLFYLFFFSFFLVVCDSFAFPLSVCAFFLFRPLMAERPGGVSFFPRLGLDVRWDLAPDGTWKPHRASKPCRQIPRFYTLGPK